jgi:hypothetical protein
MNADALHHLLHDHFSVNQKVIRGYWEKFVQNMRHYLAKFRNEVFFQEPYAVGGNKVLIFWQVLPLRIGCLEHKARLVEGRLC